MVEKIMFSSAYLRCVFVSAFVASIGATALFPQTLESRQAESVMAGLQSQQAKQAILPVTWDAKSGKLHLGVALTEASGTASVGYILSNSLTNGIGQNNLGLDRGQLEPLSESNLKSGTRLVHFDRVGPKLLLVQDNTTFRTASTDLAEQRAVRQSFPPSILASFHIDEETAGFVVVDATDFFLTDIHGVAEALAAAKQGTYHVDGKRSTIVPEFTRSFPGNTEIEAELTLVTEDASKANVLANVVPDVHAVTIHERQSFLKLPEPGFVPRRFSPRAGYFDLSYREMNTPLGVNVVQQYITRHRLQKKDPACQQECEAIAPIHYYVDRGAPEPLRSSLVEGCRWWDQAFQAAGWAKGTFLVDVLPEDADPMDARFNIIQWVHRYNRGWSYGSEIADPRTGEIVRGVVTLGSLRGRQDYLIAEALLAPYSGDQLPDPDHDKALAMVLARIRQLAAHETGHTLGLVHNYAASAMPHKPDETMSVMEYPYPWITVGKDGVPDVSHAYSRGIGVWDKVAIDYGYREFDRGGVPVEDAAGLEGILHAAEAKDILFLSDADARPAGSASPIAHLWDNGTDAADELNRLLEVRAAALRRFGQNTIRPGSPLAQMNDTLVLVYLLHRYQTEAATKIIGGLDYRYAVRGDGQAGPGLIPALEQRKALAAVVKTLSPEVLTLPEELLRQLPPRPPGLEQSVESFPSHTAVTFDPIAASESAADLTLTVLLNPERANRLVEYHARDSSLPSLNEVVDAALQAAVTHPSSGLANVIASATTARIIEALLRLSASPECSFMTRAIVDARLHALAAAQPTDAVGEAIKRRIETFERSPETFKVEPARAVPPGMPIGDEDAP